MQTDEDLLIGATGQIGFMTKAWNQKPTGPSGSYNGNCYPWQKVYKDI
jgi:hypothetical protein